MHILLLLLLLFLVCRKNAQIARLGVVHRAPDAEEQSAPDDIAGYVRASAKKSSKNFGKYMEVQKYLPADKAKRKKYLNQVKRYNCI